MKFVVDECLSHLLVQRLAARGYPDAYHPLHVGLRGVRDDTLAARAFADDRTIVTANGRDYRKLLARMTVHASAIIVEVLEREETWTQILLALAHIEQQPSPTDYMVNRIVEVTEADGVRSYELPMRVR